MSTRKILTGALVLVACLFFLSAANLLANPCVADFDCDGDVDGGDAARFKHEFGESVFNPICWPECQVPIPKTGQTTAYATGDDGNLEKGVAWPNPRFTDNEDGTVLDSFTGLIWLKDANCIGTRTWNNALSDSNGLADGSCGLTDSSSAGDWRLPNKKELFSLIHDNYYNPALSNTAGAGQWSGGDPFNNVQSSSYWSSSTNAFNPGHAWFVSIGYGYVLYDYKSSYRYVWPVRGGQ